MDKGGIAFSVFTKPWKTLPKELLAEKVRALGFDGIELPVRDGFQVEPGAADKKLPAMSRLMAEYGLHIFSVAADVNERILAACAEAGVPIVRTMLDIDLEAGYWASERAILEELERLQPLCEQYGVKIGLQPHVGARRVKSAAGLMRFLDRLDPRRIGAIWDAAHDGLRGEGPVIGLDMVWRHLCMVNLKNAYYCRTNGPEADQAEWDVHFTTGRHGMASWPRVAAYLRKRKYEGVICLTAEYTDEANVDRYVAEDIAYAKSVFAE